MTSTAKSAAAVVESSKLGAWIRDRGVRETVESILVAILLALLFRTFEAEAYIIPTGSMATNLQGRHIDVVCEECGYRYRAGASDENPTNEVQLDTLSVVCPICQKEMTLRRLVLRDHRSFAGDRILVNKFAYDFAEPERWDVIVFKYPNNGKQNYIKRLVGLPNESLLVEYGDIYTFRHDEETFNDRKIARKAPYKLLAMLHLVDDTNHLAPKLREVGWPSRWNQWSGADQGQGWSITYDEDKPRFSVSGDAVDPQMLRYRHLSPRREDWTQIARGDLPQRYRNGRIPAGELIADYFAYNDREVEGGRAFFGDSGRHWVGDLAVRAETEIKSDGGTLILDLVEGGVHFTCQIDVATGEASFSASDPAVSFVDDSGGAVASVPGASTRLKGPGKYKVTFANADDQLYLWVNGKHVDIEGSRYSRSGEVAPKYSAADPADAEPIGIGSVGLSMEITRLEVLRDLYYTSKNGSVDDGSPRNEYLPGYLFSRDVLQNPTLWETERGRTMFRSRQRSDKPQYAFRLENDQFFPMGDNSPESQDARVWPGNRYVDRSYLLGEALFIYWPHAKTKPVPFTPNFERMTFIR